MDQTVSQAELDRHCRSVLGNLVLVRLIQKHNKKYAAAQLSTSPAAIHRRIIEIEQCLDSTRNLKIFDLHSHGTPTDIGERLLALEEKIVALLEGFMMEVARARERRTSSVIHVGVIQSVWFAYKQILEKLASKVGADAIIPQFVDGNTDEVIADMVRDASVNVALVSYPTPVAAPLAMSVLGREEMVFVVSSKNASELKNGTIIKPEQIALSQQEFITTNNKMGSSVLDYLGRHHLLNKLSLRHKPDTVQIALKMVANDDGVSIVPLPSITAEFRRSIKYFHLSGTIPLRRPLALIYRQAGGAESTNELVDKFVQYAVPKITKLINRKRYVPKKRV